MSATQPGKYAHLVKELPLQKNIGSFEQGAVMDGAFFGLDKFSVRYGMVGAPGMIEEETPCEHTHDYDQLLWFFGSDPTDATKLDAEVEITMGEERIRHRFNTPTVIAIPKGMPHFSPIVTSLSDKIYVVAASGAPAFKAEVTDPDARPDCGKWGEFYNNPYKKYVVNLRFYRKDAYHYGSARAVDSGGMLTYFNGNDLGINMIMSCETVSLPHQLGPRTADMGYHSHSHVNKDEMLIFLSSDKEDLSDLHGSADFCFGPDRALEHYTVTKATCMVTPAKIFHLPLRFERVDRPMYFMTIDTEF